MALRSKKEILAKPWSVGLRDQAWQKSLSGVLDGLKFGKRPKAGIDGHY